MTYPMMPQPNWGYAPAPALRTGRNWLVLTSVLLSFAVPPVVVALLGLNVVLNFEAPNVVNVVVALACLLASIGAVVTGAVALGRAHRYLPQQAQRVRGWAMVGFVFGLVDSGVIIAGWLLALWINHLCFSGPPGCL